LIITFYPPIIVFKLTPTLFSRTCDTFPCSCTAVCCLFFLHLIILFEVAFNFFRVWESVRMVTHTYVQTSVVTVSLPFVLYYVLCSPQQSSVLFTLPALSDFLSWVTTGLHFFLNFNRVLCQRFVLSGTKNYHLDLLTTTPLSISPILNPPLHFTHDTAASLHLPILDALQPPTRRARSASAVSLSHAEFLESPHRGPCSLSV
jgi:hypothetical protein